MLIDTDGIVLRNTKFGESSNIVSIYTLSEGVLSFSFRKKQGKTGTAALLTPLSLIHLVADIRQNQHIHHTRELSLNYHYQSVPYDPAKGCVLLFFNELLIKVLKEEEPNAPLFGFIVHMLQVLDQQTPLHPSYHLSAMIRLASFLGFFPMNGNWVPGMCFDLREGIFTHPPIMHPDYAGSELSSRLNEFINVPFDEYQQFHIKRDDRNRLLDLLIGFYQLHTAGFGRMKSLDVLRSVFD